MKCSKCDFDNPEGMKFCGGCGSKLAAACPNCEFTNPPGFKFCGNCGHDLIMLKTPKSLKETPSNDKLNKLIKYLPEGLINKILSQKDKIVGERKQVTVMFCDMAGFTPFMEKLGPDEGYTIMDQIYEILIHKVQDYDGTVNEMTGDGIMALFGAPIAIEDAPQRAIRSSLAIHREISKCSDKLSNKGIPSIKLRAGINTGTVVVGSLGNDLRVEFKAVGDTVNVASRIEGLAEPGTTLVSENTFKLSEGFFRFESLGERKIKGKEEPIKVYQVIAPSGSRTRFDVSAERGLSQFVGRISELDLLSEGFERIKEGQGQAFSIVSEAGIGKSRLLYEFRKKISSEDAIFLEGRCLSYSHGISYHPVIDILKANLDIRDEDDDPTIRNKVIKGLKILEIDGAFALPYLLELFSVKDSGFDEIKMSPDAKKERVMEIVKMFTIKGARIRPVITAFEDLHWADKSSEEVLKYVLGSIPAARAMMIFTYRPEFVHTWAGKSYHNQINLNRLSNRESLEMVKSLLEAKVIDRKLEELILEKTEGVPYYIEEFVKSLDDMDMIEKTHSTYSLTQNIEAVSVPSTIQGVITTRVDRLPEQAKELLQTGSVIEREFSYELIKNVSYLNEKQLLSALSALKEAELLYERGIYPDSTYIFKHALTRDVVYDSIIAGKKRQLHEKIGNSIEELYSTRLEQKYEVLANHYSNAENWKKSVHYAQLAAERAHKLSLFHQAVNLFEKTTEWIKKLPDSRSQQENLLAIYLELCWSNIGLGQFGKVEEVALKAEKIAEKLGDNIQLGIAYLGLGTACVYRGKFEKTERYTLLAIKYLEDTPEERSFAIANLVLGACYIGQGLWHKSEPCFSKTVKIYDKLGSKTEYVMGWNALPYTIVCGQLGYNYAVIGRVTEGKELFDKGFAADLEQVSNLTTKMAFCSWQGLFISLVGKDYFRALSKINNLVNLAERSGSPFMMLVFNAAKANILLGLEEYDMVIGTCNNALSAIEGTPIRTGHVTNVYYDMILAYLNLGNQDQAIKHFDQGRLLVDLAPNWWGPRFLFIEALLRDNKNQPEYEKIEELYNKSAKDDESVGAVVPAAQTRFHLAKMLFRKGDSENAYRLLTNLRNCFQKYDIPVWRKKCEYALEPYHF
jgi:class 3 adenylate cyclase/tetratricopeptide (TPR) repeat protein